MIERTKVWCRTCQCLYDCPHKCCMNWEPFYKLADIEKEYKGMTVRELIA
jgi:hypothetical protein